jgi:outer membrane protein TolC
MYLATELDCGPKPEDDAAAWAFQSAPRGLNNTKYYSKIATRSNTENPIWLDHLPRNEASALELNQTLAMDLALLHSRDYQQQFEGVYLNSLALSGNRFEFRSQWFGGLGASYTATGEDLGSQRGLSVTANRLGLTRSLPGGGQFATNILNSLFWDFGTGGVQTGSASLVTTFTQPLLRGAFRHVRLESLSQAERSLLYSVRDFARFRRQFYLQITQAYFDLLTQAQAIRNSQTNLENLKQNLIEHEFYGELKMVSQLQVDQVFQQYQNGRRSLLAAEQNLLASQDAFKFQLGLPAWLQIEVDESLLQPFELVSQDLNQLQLEAQALFEEIVQYLPPEQAPIEKLQGFVQRFSKLREQTVQVLPVVEEDLVKWETKLKADSTEPLTTDDRLDRQQQRNLSVATRTRLDELKGVLKNRQTFLAELEKVVEAYEVSSKQKASGDGPRGSQEKEPTVDGSDQEFDVDEILKAKPDTPAIAAWKAVQDAVGERLRGEIAELYVAQTQIRLFLIDVDRIEVDQQAAINFAHHHRLDLMNRRAIVMDAFRKVEVAADALQSELNLTGGATLGSDPSRNNAFRLDSSSARYNVGVAFDGPLNRLNERNAYRAAQIAYQQSSRGFTADRDQVANDVRSILRRLELSRLSFLIARQQVVTAARQVDQAQIDLRNSAEGESNLTLFLLQALEGLLDAKNNLISNWVDYRVQKMQLFVALDLLYLDDQGQWINEADGLQVLEQWKDIPSEYFPMELPEVGTDIKRSDEELNGGKAGGTQPTEAPDEDNNAPPESVPFEAEI